MAAAVDIPFLNMLEAAEARLAPGAVGLLVLCVQEPDLSLKRIAASALSDIAKHTPELAQAVVDAGAVLQELFEVVAADDGGGGRGGGGQSGAGSGAWNATRHGCKVDSQADAIVGEDEGPGR